ncbi:MAG TPA: hypothetical protein VNX21_03005, partial [Candidatus Thermoplasmatota archaeon]|nr:hypothetical protein [Candidatus Thermoplasmatota archaeon]
IGAVLLLAGAGHALLASQAPQRAIESGTSGCPGRMRLDAEPMPGGVLVAPARGEAGAVPFEGTGWLVQVGGDVYRGGLAHLARDGVAALARPQGGLSLRYVDAQAPADAFGAGDRFEVVGAEGLADFALLRGAQQAAGLLDCV